MPDLAHTGRSSLADAALPHSRKLSFVSVRRVHLATMVAMRQLLPLAGEAEEGARALGEHSVQSV